MRDVLRLQTGEKIRVFDNSGNQAQADIIQCNAAGVVVRIESISVAQTSNGRLGIASAIPKAGRADWMVEKLVEIGVDEWIPLHCRRSVVLPQGQNKFARWRRLAVEAAKQSQRSAAMEIGEIITPGDLLADRPMFTWYLSPRQAKLILDAIKPVPLGAEVLLLIGPEGGWAEEEIAAFTAAGILPVKLTDTILRVETAALAAAAVLRCRAATVPG